MHRLLKNRFLNTASFLLSPDEQGNPTAQEQRDAINVNISEATSDKNNVTDTDDTNDTNNADETNDDDEDVDDDDDKDENEDDDKEKGETKEDEKVEETEEEKKAKAAKEKEDRKSARQQRKWDKLAAEKKAAEDEVAELKAKLLEKPVDGLTEEEVERRAEEKAALKLAEKKVADETKAFEDSCDALEAAATKVDEKFNKKLTDMVEEIGPVPRPLVFILSDLDNGNGGEVLNYLADNVDEAEDIYELSPHKMTQKLVRISDKLKEAKKPVPRQRSKAPEPLNTIREGTRPEVTTLTGKEDMDTFIRVRAKQDEARRKSKGFA